MARTSIVIRYPGVTILLSVLLVVFLAGGLENLRLNTDFRIYFDPSDERLLEFKRINEEFVRNEAVLFALAPEEGDIFTNEFLQVVRNLAEEAAWLPWAWQTYAITTLTESVAEGDEIHVRPIIPDGPLSDAGLRNVRENAFGNVNLRNGLLAPDGRATGVVVYFEMPHEDAAAENKQVAEAAQALADTFARPGVQIYVSGSMPFNHAFVESIRHDAEHLYPQMYGLILLLLLVLFRSFGASFAVLLLISGSVIAGYGVAGFMGVELSTTALAAGTIIMTISIADSVHILGSWYSGMRDGLDTEAAMQHSLRVNLRPVMLTSLTTAIGFLGTNLGDSQPFADLGNIVAVGVTMAFLLSLTFLPALMISLPGMDEVSGRTRGQALSKWLDRVGDRMARRPGTGAVLLLLLLIIVMTGLPRNQFGDNYVLLFDENIPFREAAEFADKRLAGQQLIEYLFDAGEAGDVFDPTFLARLDRFESWLRDQPEVRRISTLTAILKNQRQVMQGGEPEEYRIPESRAEAAQYYHLVEMSLPPGQDLNFVVNMQKDAVRLSVSLDAIDSERILSLVERADAWQAAHLPAEMRAPATGMSVLFAQIARRNFASMMWGAAAAFGVIALIFLLALRQPLLALVSVATNLLPLLAGFGLWGYLNGHVNLGLTIVASMTLGIVVDDTIHLLMRYQQARDGGDAPAEAVRYALRTVGVAIVLTTLVLLVGFAVLTQSTFTLTSQLGLLTAMVITIALFVDLVIVPALLPWLDRRRAGTS